jgi:phosphopantetheinyl transferase
MILFFYKGNNEPGHSEALTLKAIEFYCRRKSIDPYDENGKISLIRDDLGKPVLPESPDVHISVSHSGAFWVCGIQNKPLGIDIEAYKKRGLHKLSLISEDKLMQQKQDLPNQCSPKTSDKTHESSLGRILKIANRFYNDDEISYINTHGEDAFYQIWVRKEAYIKYLGKGLSFGLKNVSTIQDNRFLQKFSDAFIAEIQTNESWYGAYCSTSPLFIEETIEFV